MNDNCVFPVLFFFLLSCVFVLFSNSFRCFSSFFLFFSFVFSLSFSSFSSLLLLPPLSFSVLFILSHHLSTSTPSDGIAQSLLLTSKSIASMLLTKRQYMEPDDTSPATFHYDPRMLVFEFAHSLVLRKSQVDQVRLFSKSDAIVHQMVMGAGKTTVVGPLLALLAASNNDRLVTLCCPAPLLEFSRGTLRERFSAVIRKSIYTFRFSRSSRATKKMHDKLIRVRDCGSILVTSPAQLKGLLLSYVSTVHDIDETLVTKANGLSTFFCFLFFCFLFFWLFSFFSLFFFDDDLNSFPKSCQNPKKISPDSQFFFFSFFLFLSLFSPPNIHTLLCKLPHEQKLKMRMAWKYDMMIGLPI